MTGRVLEPALWGLQLQYYLEWYRGFGICILHSLSVLLLVGNLCQLRTASRRGSPSVSLRGGPSSRLHPKVGHCSTCTDPAAAFGGQAAERGGDRRYQDCARAVAALPAAWRHARLLHQHARGASTAVGCLWLLNSAFSLVATTTSLSVHSDEDMCFGRINVYRRLARRY